MGLVYLLHFGTPHKHAKHYVGYTDDLDARLQDHLKGRGSPLIKAVVATGNTVVVARTWEGDRNFERSIKNQKNTPRYCPICQGIGIEVETKE